MWVCTPTGLALALAPEPQLGPHHAATTRAEEWRAGKDAAERERERERGMEKEGGITDAKRSSQETGDELQK